MGPLPANAQAVIASACNVSGGGTAFVDALNTIRGSVTKTETHFETHQEIQQTKLACEFTLPAPPDGQKFDKEKVNVEFTTAAGKQEIYNVSTLAERSAGRRKSSAQGGYFDLGDPVRRRNPRAIFGAGR